MLTVSGIQLHDDIKLIKKYAYFCLSKFVKNSVLKNSIINIKFLSKNELDSSDAKKELKEFEAWMTYEGMVGKKRKFEIVLYKEIISKKSKKQISKYKKSLKNLGHELVHVKQYLNNEMFDYADGASTRFKGERHYYNGKDEWSYWDAPYEIEAYGRSDGLYTMFVKKLKEENRKKA